MLLLRTENDSQFQFCIINHSVSSTKWSYKTEMDYMEQLLEDFWEIVGAGNLIYWYIWSTSKTEKFPLVSNDLNSSLTFRSGHWYRQKDLQKKPSIRTWEVELEIMWRSPFLFSLSSNLKHSSDYMVAAIPAVTGAENSNRGKPSSSTTGGAVSRA